MRLLHVKSLKLIEFLSNPPPYAILSHTWAEEEVLFQDFSRTKNGDFILASEHSFTKKGYHKIHYLCRQAVEDGYAYVWIDTACIDKSSSAELSESLRSMLAWYRDAEICYAYLGDVKDVSGLAEARWFTRGWTLQELIAPKHMVFYGRNWTFLGRKKAMADELSLITRIPHLLLQHPGLLTEYSVAQRMSWASRRTTARSEDVAYCLLGIFDVYIMPIYGEGGGKAFMRLQHEILKQNSDDSIMAWTCPPAHVAGPNLGNHSVVLDIGWSPGGLAVHPKFFHDCGSIIKTYGGPEMGKVGAPQNIRIEKDSFRVALPVLKNTDVFKHASDDGNLLWGVLQCRSTSGPLGYVGIPLRTDRQLADNSNIAVRFVQRKIQTISVDLLKECQNLELRVEGFDNWKDNFMDTELFPRSDTMVLRCDSLLMHGFRIIHPRPAQFPDTWNEETRISEVTVAHETIEGDTGGLLRRFIFYSTERDFAFSITTSTSDDDYDLDEETKPEGANLEQWLQLQGGFQMASKWDQNALDDETARRHSSTILVKQETGLPALRISMKMVREQIEPINFWFAHTRVLEISVN